MEPEAMGAKLAEFVARQHDGSILGPDELTRLLAELNDLSSQVHDLPAGDLQASTAKIDELRLQYTQWLDAAVEHRDTAKPMETVAMLDQEFARYRGEWLDGDERTRSVREADMVDCLARVNAKPDGEQLSEHIKTFLRVDAGLPGF